MASAERASAAWEELVVERVAAGDETALEELYSRFSSLVYGLALRVTGERLAAEEVCQEVFLRIWQRPLEFDPARGSLRCWLSVLAHRRAVDWLRHETAGRRRERRDGERSIRASAPPEVSDQAAATVAAGHVRAALESLPEEQRVPLVLAYFDGLTYRQVGAFLGIPEGTAKSRLRLGLRRLAEHLAHERVDG